MGLPNSDGKAPAEPVNIGTAGEVSFQSQIRMPDGFTFEIPGEARMRTAFADYRGANSFAAGVLKTERTLHITTEKVPVSAWADYQKLAQAVAGDHDELIQLARTSGKAEAVVIVNNPQAEALVRQAFEALSRKDLPAAKTALEDAERLNPKQRFLWYFRGGFDQLSGDLKTAIADQKKEVKTYPENLAAWVSLGVLETQLGLTDDALASYKEGFEKLPGNPNLADLYSKLLITRKRYADAAEVARLGLNTDKNNQFLKTDLLKALLQGGKKDEGITMARQMIGETDDALALNNVAYQLGDSGTELPLAQQYADKAVARFEDQLKDLDVNALNADDLSRTSWLAAAWDTLGWIFFREGDLTRAETYLSAAWGLIQGGEVADHLGDLYFQQGKRDAAIHHWALALAANSKLPGVREKLDSAEKSAPGQSPAAKPDSGPQAKANPARSKIDPAEELGKLRTFDLPSIHRTEGSAEFFVVFSRAAPLQTRFIAGDEAMRGVAEQLPAAGLQFKLPGDGPERIVRRGIVSCSKYTKPACQFVLIPANLTKLQ